MNSNVDITMINPYQNENSRRAIWCLGSFMGASFIMFMVFTFVLAPLLEEFPTCNCLEPYIDMKECACIGDCIWKCTIENTSTCFEETKVVDCFMYET